MKWQLSSPTPKFELKEAVTKNFEVVLTERAYAKIFAYTDAVSGEISGMGEVVKVGDVYRVTDVWLLKQRCTGASTHIEAAALADLRAEMFAEGKALEGFRLWWHSHADMGTFWSGTDTANMDLLMQDIDWLLSIVVNKKRSMLARVDLKVPFPAFVNDIPICVESDFAVNAEELKEEVKKKVTDGWGAGGRGKGEQSLWQPTSRWEDDDFFRGGQAGDSIEDKTAPISARGEHYWRGMSRKERKTVKKYSGEPEPLCVPGNCQACKTAGYVFYIRHLRNLLCLECITNVVKAAEKNIKVTYRGLVPIEKEELIRTYRETKAEEAGGSLEGGHHG